MGSIRSLLKFLRPWIAPARTAWAGANDAFLNIDTRASVSHRLDRREIRNDRANSAVQPKHQDSVAYETPDYWYVRRIRRELKQAIQSTDVLFDLGAGKGRILCVMAGLPFQRVVGVELNEDLCRIAEHNAQRLRGRHAPITIVRADAAEADLSEGTVFFMFNPFGRNTLATVLENLMASLVAKPRPMRVIYYNALHADLCDATSWLDRVDKFTTASGLEVISWMNLAGNESRAS